MEIILTEKDKQEILQEFPLLNCSLKQQVIWGTLEIACSFDSDTEEIILGSSSDDYEYIEDSYEIRIDFNQLNLWGLPKVFEESSAILDFACSTGMDPGDLHLYDDRSCCLGIFPDFCWLGAANYITNEILPFFYWQSHFRIHGEEARKGYSHGSKGIEEAMSIPVKEVLKGHNRNKPCPCGSGKKYKNCCIKRDEILKMKWQQYKKFEKNQIKK